MYNTMKSHKNNGATSNRYTSQYPPNQMLGSKKGTEKQKSAKNVAMNGDINNVKTKGARRQIGQQFKSTEKSGAEDVLHLFENVCKHLSHGNFEPAVIAAVVHLNAGLKIYGTHLESLYKAQLDEFTGTLRKACRESDLDLVARLQLLEIIEMRNMKWEPNETVLNYYKQKVNQVENSTAREALDYVSNSATFDLKAALSKSLASTSKGLNPYAPDFTPVLTARYLAKASNSLANMLHLGPSSGTASSSDEQADCQFSSDLATMATAGSPKKVNVSPKGLNQSPRKSKRNKNTLIPPPSPSGDSKASGDGTFIRVGQEYQATIGSGDDSIKIEGKNQDLIEKAKHAIEEYFAKLTKQDSNLAKNNASVIASQIINSTVDSCMSRSAPSSPMKRGSPSKRGSPKKRVSISEDLEVINGNNSAKEKARKENVKKYDRKDLLRCSDSPFSKIVPIVWSDDWEQVRAQHPALIRYDLILGVQGTGSKRPQNMPPIPDFDAEPSFPGFVKSMPKGTEQSSPDTSPRTEHHVAKINNNDRLMEHIKPQGPVKTWDEFKEQWVEVAPALNS